MWAWNASSETRGPLKKSKQRRKRRRSKKRRRGDNRETRESPTWKGEDRITPCLLVAQRSTLPFLFRYLQPPLCFRCVAVAREVDDIEMCHSRISILAARAGTLRVRIEPRKRHAFAERVESENLVGLEGVSLAAYHAREARLLLEVFYALGDNIRCNSGNECIRRRIWIEGRGAEGEEERWGDRRLLRGEVGIKRRIKKIPSTVHL